MKDHYNIPIEYKNPYGTWKISTEADVESRSMKDLGIFTGFIDQIALHLADKCFYTLRFEAIKPQRELFPKREEVHIVFDGDAGVSILPSVRREDFAKKLFKDRPVSIKEGKFYGSVLIRANFTEEERENMKKERILSKLTPEERHILGF